MAKLKNIEPLVREALINNPDSRGDNFILYAEVLRHFCSINRLTFAEVCVHHVQLGVPSLETITRCRRKLQEKDPSLKDTAAAEIRENEEEEYREYSREKVWKTN